MWPSTRSAFAQAVVDVLAQWRQKKIDDAPLARKDLGLDGHAGQQHRRAAVDL